MKKNIHIISVINIVLLLASIVIVSAQTIDTTNSISKPINLKTDRADNYFSLSGGLGVQHNWIAYYGSFDYHFANYFYTTIRLHAGSGFALLGRAEETVSMSFPIGLSLRNNWIEFKLGTGPSRSYFYRYIDKVIGSTLGGLAPVYAEEERRIFGLSADANLLFHISKSVSIGFFHMYDMNSYEDYFLYGLKLNIDLK